MASLIAQALAHEKAGRIAEAEKLLRQAAAAAPKDPKPFLEMVRFFLRIPNALPGAFGPLKTLLALQPKSAEAHRLAAQAYFSLGDMALGEDHGRRAVELAPKDPEAHYVLAYILESLGDVQAALAEAELTLSLAPDHRHAARTRASVLMSLGRMEEAADACRAIHAANPDHLAIYNVYARTGKLAEDDPMIRDLKERMLPLAAKSTPMLHAAALLTVAKVAQDQGDHRAAFQYYAASKAAHPAHHDIPAYRRFVDTQVKGISRADFFGWAGSSDERPVFIVGMPRSGSTLLEQILSGHRQIGGIGESHLMSQISRRMGLPGQDGPRMVAALKALRPDQAHALADAYLAPMATMQPDADRVVDKFLHNYEKLGLIAKLFPKARILHALRDPMDNCVSCYMASLSSWHSYTRDLTSLGKYYVQHRRLMDHWKNVLPNPIMEVRYEDVVADTEGKARAVIDFLGLDWDPNCLKFQENENRAKTLSAWQVRQPIYTTSVKRWKKYEEFLDPLKEELKGFYPGGV